MGAETQVNTSKERDDADFRGRVQQCLFRICPPDTWAAGVCTTFRQFWHWWCCDQCNVVTTPVSSRHCKTKRAGGGPNPRKKRPVCFGRDRANTLGTEGHWDGYRTSIEPASVVPRQSLNHRTGSRRPATGLLDEVDFPQNGWTVRRCSCAVIWTPTTMTSRKHNHVATAQSLHRLLTKRRVKRMEHNVLHTPFRSVFT